MGFFDKRPTALLPLRGTMLRKGVVSFPLRWNQGLQNFRSAVVRAPSGRFALRAGKGHGGGDRDGVAWPSFPLCRCRQRSTPRPSPAYSAGRHRGGWRNIRADRSPIRRSCKSQRRAMPFQVRIDNFRHRALRGRRQRNLRGRRYVLFRAVFPVENLCQDIPGNCRGVRARNPFPEPGDRTRVKAILVAIRSAFSNHGRNIGRSKNGGKCPKCAMQRHRAHAVAKV